MVKKYTKKIVLLLAGLIIFNLVGVFIAPEVAHAVATLRPNSDGNYTQWTPSTGTTHYPLVNDQSDATYVYTTTDLSLDSYGLAIGQLPSGSNVTQIKVWARAIRNHPSKTAAMTIFYRRNSTDTFGSSQSITDSWADYSQTWSGLSWTDTDVDNLQIGVRLDNHQPGTSPSVSEMWIEVTYYAISSLTTDKGSYPTLGETITVNSTVKNGSSAILSGTTADYVIFIDTNGDHQPTAGETYITNGCAGSGSWSSGNYTHQWSVPDVAVDGTQSDNWACSNSNFPQNTTYRIWQKWYSGATTYDTAYVTFTSVPTLGEVLFVVLLALILFLVIRLIWLFKKKRHWLIYYLMAAFSMTLAIIFFARRFGIDQFLVNTASFHVHLIAERLFEIPIDILANGRLQIFFANGGSSILKLGIECSAIIESSILVGLMLLLPIFSIRQRLLRVTFGLVVTYVINIIRLMIIVLITYKFGPDYIFVAHAAAGRLFFFIFEIFLFWFLFTKPIVKSVGDSIGKKVPVAKTARSGRSLQWHYTYAQLIIALIVIVIILISFRISDNWKKIYEEARISPPAQGIMGQQSSHLRIDKIEPSQTKIYNFSMSSAGQINIMVAEGKEPLEINLYLNRQFQNRTIIGPTKESDSIIEAIGFAQPIEILPGDILELRFKNLGDNLSSYSIEIIK